jgi:3-oxoacyl-[acyl-carrier protein] reductase
LKDSGEINRIFINANSLQFPQISDLPIRQQRHEEMQRCNDDYPGILDKSTEAAAMNNSEFARLDGLRAVVTGASSGIGRAIAWELARAGADLLVHCRHSMEAAQKLAQELKQAWGREAIVLAADLEREPELQAFADRAWGHWNGLDIWVNNAGADNLTGAAAQLDYAAKLQRLLNIDVRGTLLLSRSIGVRMQAAGRGVILNIGWDQADRGMEGESGELFSAAKNAVMGFTRSLAVSLAPQVRVNCIAPGWIRTAWGAQASETWQQRVRRETPLQRWGEPEDIARLARFLVSSEAAYLTGQVINANGGAVR